MPDISADTPRQDFKFKGVSVSVPMAFAEGQTLSANEAAFYNRQLASVVGNVFAAQITRRLTEKEKALAEAGTPRDATIADLGASELQTAFDALYTKYEPGVSNRGNASHADPIDAIANRIASAKVRELLKAKGYNISKVRAVEGKFDALVTEYRTKNPWVDELAKSEHEAMTGNTAAPDELELDGLFAEGDVEAESNAAAQELASDEVPAPTGE